MDRTNGADRDENLSPPPPSDNGEKIVILDAGAQYGKVITSFKGNLLLGVLLVTFFFTLLCIGDRPSC